MSWAESINLIYNTKIDVEFNVANILYIIVFYPLK